MQATLGTREMNGCFANLGHGECARGSALVSSFSGEQAVWGQEGDREQRPIPPESNGSPSATRNGYSSALSDYTKRNAMDVLQEHLCLRHPGYMQTPSFWCHTFMRLWVGDLIHTDESQPQARPHGTTEKGVHLRLELFCRWM